MIKQTIEHNASVKPTDSVLAKLHADFPQCFSKDGKFDIEKFQNMIQPETDITREGYDLNFLGKNYANLIACTETETVIQPDLEHNAQPENVNSQNVYISGDNLDALKHLLKSYSRRVKCIYIDPPYNTGSDGFVYNDKFNFTPEQLQTKLGVSEEKAKRILDLCTRGSASHSAWLMFMAPRLMLARDLLTDDGVIFISIDDNEQANLKLLCDSVFGEENFISDIIWNSTKSVTNTALISVSHTYTLVYCTDKNYFVKNRTEFRLDDNGEGFSNPDNDPRGAWKADPFQVGGYRENQQYEIINPKTGVSYKPNPGSSWKNDYEHFKKLLEDNRIVFGATGEAGPQRKRFIWEAEERGCVSKTLWTDVETTTNGTDLLKKLFNNKLVFSNPKPVGLINRILELGAKEDSYVLDFFSGSGTTAHSVLFSNRENPNRHYKFIAIQLPENLDISLKNANDDDREYIVNSIEVCDSINRPHSLDYVGYERIRRAAAKIKSDIQEEIPQLEKQLKTKEEKLAKASKQKSMFEEENPLVKEIEDLKAKIENNRKALETTDFGFKHYTLQEVDKKTLDKMERFEPNNAFSVEVSKDILQEFGKETVLETWCVKDGYGFGANVVELQLAKYTAYHCGSHLYFVSGECFDENAVIALIDKYNSDPSFNPQNIVMFGYSFTFTQAEMLRKNLNTLKDSAKNLNINIDVRY